MERRIYAQRPACRVGAGRCVRHAAGGQIASRRPFASLRVTGSAGVTSRSRTPHCRHSRARCSFLSPSPLGGRGRGEGGCWRHLEPLVTSPLSLRLRLRSAQGGALILSPGGGEESGKEGALAPAALSVPTSQMSRIPCLRQGRVRGEIASPNPFASPRVTGRRVQGNRRKAQRVRGRSGLRAGLARHRRGHPATASLPSS